MTHAKLACLPDIEVTEDHLQPSPDDLDLQGRGITHELNWIMLIRSRDAQIQEQLAIMRATLEFRKQMMSEIKATRKLAQRLKNRCGKAVTACLSDREFEVIELIGKGVSTMQISTRLNIDISTVETYLSRIKKKLHLRDWRALLQYAIHGG